MNAQELYKKMVSFAQTLPAGTDRAQAYNIAQNLKGLDLIESSIAEMMMNDSRSQDGALRNAQLLIDAGLCEEKKAANPIYFGEFHFVDGSKLGG